MSKKHLAYYENEWPANIAELTAIENKPFVGYLKGLGVEYTMVPEPEEPASYEAVDLGLPSGLKWANMNVRASKPEEYGDYFAWGELSSKDSYIDSNYKFGGEVMSKYNSTDGLMQLLSVDDIAHISLGDSWHIPTKDDVSELIENTTSEWIADYNSTGVSGRLFTGVNGNSIFIPASGCISGEEHLGNAGYCQAWSSSLSTSNEARALCLYFDAEQVFRASDFRNQGFVIRPVKY